MTTIFILLLLCHWAADYTALLTPWMIKAKAFGSELLPIFAHAIVHTILMCLVLVFFVESFPVLLLLLLGQLISHFLMDLLKGRLTYYIPIFRDNQRYWYRSLMGADQVVHMIVIFWMTKTAAGV